MFLIFFFFTWRQKANKMAFQQFMHFKRRRGGGKKVIMVNWKWNWASMDNCNVTVKPLGGIQSTESRVQSTHTHTLGHRAWQTLSIWFSLTTSIWFLNPRTKCSCFCLCQAFHTEELTRAALKTLSLSAGAERHKSCYGGRTAVWLSMGAVVGAYLSDSSPAEPPQEETGWRWGWGLGLRWTGEEVPSAWSSSARTRWRTLDSRMGYP